LGIAVVIRTRDREIHFDSLLRSLSIQTVLPSEVVVVNNYSNEEQCDSFRKHLVEQSQKVFRDRKVRVKLLAIPDDEFSHAYSTNLGPAASDEELICITNGHSLPISSSWLEHGARHFGDLQVAGVSGYFYPHHRSKIFTRLDCALYQFSQRSILRQDWCSTINAMIRKSLWEVYPFDENLPNMIQETGKYGLEDYDWSKEMIARSFKIVIDPAFSVYHSHDNSLKETVRNVKGYFIYRKLQKRINSLERPKVSYSRVLEKGQKHLASEAIF
jgi:hypothetical protein